MNLWISSIITAFIAIIYSISLIDDHSSKIDTTSFHPDTSSAIERATTWDCKQQIIDFAIKSSTDKFYPEHIARKCILDQLDEPRFVRLNGSCVSNITNNLVFVNESRVQSRKVCLLACFSYNMNYGYFNRKKNTCYCTSHVSDTLENNCDTDSNEYWYQINQKSNIPASSEGLTRSNHVSTKQMKIAFLLILNGRSVMQIMKLLAAIYSDKHIYYLHIDKRDDYLFEQFIGLENIYTNIFLVRNRFVTIWGSPKLLEMILDSMQQLLQQHRQDFDYLMNLSGSDYPIKSLDELEAYLSIKSNDSMIYLRFHDINGYDFIRKQGLEHNFFQCDDRAWRLGPRQLPLGIVYTGGSDWFALPKSFCSYIIGSIYISKSGIPWDLLRLYRHSLLPVESYFHTIAINSEYCSKISNNNLKITNWNRKKGCNCQHKNIVDWCGCSPSIYRIEDWNKLKKVRGNKELFFARKFDCKISSKIIKLIDSTFLEKSTNVSTIVDSRYWESIWTDRYDPISNVTNLASFMALSWHLGSNETIYEDLESLLPVSFDSYFNDDQFIGWVLNFSRIIGKSFEILIERKSNRIGVGEICISNSGYTLKRLEVNHNYDKSEETFRNYSPLTIDSDIFVEQQWITHRAQPLHNDRFTSHLNLLWTHLASSMKFNQLVRFPIWKTTKVLSLVNRMKIDKPLMQGWWTLNLIFNATNCGEYSFLVNGPDTKQLELLDRTLFASNYRVSKPCEAPCFEYWSPTKQRSMYRSRLV